MNLDEVFEGLDDALAVQALKVLLSRFLDPAFGALPKSEIELIVLQALVGIGAVSNDPAVYELVTKLKVTRSKARNLIYERELRRLTGGELDERVKRLLKRPLIQKSGEVFVLEVENPLVSDHLRSKVQALGHVSDGSFSPSIVKLPLEAIVALIELYIPEEERAAVRDALVAAGAPDTSFKGVLKAVLKKVAKKVASETGEALLDSASDYISPIVDGAIEQIRDTVAEVFEAEAGNEDG